MPTQNRAMPAIKSVKTFAFAATIAAALLVAASCSNIDCPLSNTVASKYVFYNTANGAAATFADTLTVRAIGSDTVLYNRGLNISEVDIPMSYRAAADTLLLDISDTEAKRTDTLIVAHTNEAHFESIDCSASMFHQITSATLRPGTGGGSGLTRIDSVAVNKRNVNYNVVENIKVFITAP